MGQLNFNMHQTGIGGLLLVGAFHFVRSVGGPCEDKPCGPGARCQVRGNNQAICSCPQGLEGDPFVGCRAECYKLSDCPFDKQCQGSPGRCVDPCTNNIETGDFKRL